MENIDIKDIWNESGASEKIYTLEEIQNYRAVQSNLVKKSSRNIILFDMAFKCLIILALINLGFILQHSLHTGTIETILSIVIFILLVTDFIILKNLSQVTDTDSVRSNLLNRMQFLNTDLRLFQFISALSSPLFVLTGFMYYYFYKYQDVTRAIPSDDVVPYLFLLVAFIISYFSQSMSYQQQRREVKECLNDFDDPKMASQLIITSKKNKRRFLIMVCILMTLGIIALVILLLVYNSKI